MQRVSDSLTPQPNFTRNVLTSQSQVSAGSNTRAPQQQSATVLRSKSPKILTVQPNPAPVVAVDNSVASQRNQNILCAVLALLKELDDSGLELVKRDIDRKLQKRH